MLNVILPAIAGFAAGRIRPKQLGTLEIKLPNGEIVLTDSARVEKLVRELVMAVQKIKGRPATDAEIKSALLSTPQSRSRK